MSEQNLPISDEVIGRIWESAEFANDAHDDLRATQEDLEAFDHLRAMANIVLRDEDETALLLGVEAARRDFDIAVSMVPDLKQDGLTDHPAFAPNSNSETDIPLAQELPDLPKIDPEAGARLEALPADFRERVLTCYIERSAAVAGYVRNGKLPEDYLLTDIKELVDRIEPVASSFEHMQKQGWQPEVVFVPQGLSPEQWNGLFKGQELPDGSKMEGTYRSLSGETSDPTNSKPDTDSLWDVVVIDAADRPTFTNISKDGTHGSNAKKAVKELAKLPSVKDNSSAEIIVAQCQPPQITNTLSQTTWALSWAA